ncbi:hypothetical protein [Spartinivicinus poritis]|uniref:Uncharacterized protein n=1 Tax=Spartinivicinus poritis TaxID=2994640 RepID=A0ABT5UE35_9GAMM|nr:hypothetical protein [Spartinivicinus sp. A2-2]MDE1464628.1 hypothetical protein [Spartinivicinus sp. A2-2]
MKTQDLLRLSDDEFTTAVELMKADECERHAQHLSTLLGGPIFEQLFMDVFDSLSKGPRSEEQLMGVHSVVADHFPNVDFEDDALGRLSTLVLIAVFKRTNKFDLLGCF